MADLRFSQLPAIDVQPYIEELNRYAAITVTAIELMQVTEQFMEDGGEPWQVLAGERAFLGQAISETELATLLVDLT